MSNAHPIIPEGQSKDDFANQDFCFYDAIEIQRTPESVRALQMKLRDDLLNKVLAAQDNGGMDSPSAIRANKESPPKRKVSSKRKSGLQVHVSPMKGDGMETVDIRMTKGLGQEIESPPNSALEVNLNKPAMRKTKTKGVAGGKKHSKKSGLVSKKKHATQNLTSAAISSDESHASFQKGGNHQKLKNLKG